MARMMDRMMTESLQPFGFARVTARRAKSDKGDDPPRDGLRSEKGAAKKDRIRPDTHAHNGTRHPPTQGIE